MSSHSPEGDSPGGEINHNKGEPWAAAMLTNDTALRRLCNDNLTVCPRQETIFYAFVHTYVLPLLLGKTNPTSEKCINMSSIYIIYI